MLGRVIGEDPLKTKAKTAQTTKAAIEVRTTRPRFFISTPLKVDDFYERCRKAVLAIGVRASADGHPK
jgi:hypothetical protein